MVGGCIWRVCKERGWWLAQVGEQHLLSYDGDSQGVGSHPRDGRTSQLQEGRGPNTGPRPRRLEGQAADC